MGGNVHRRPDVPGKDAAEAAVDRNEHAGDPGRNAGLPVAHRDHGRIIAGAEMVGATGVCYATRHPREVCPGCGVEALEGAE